MEATPPGSLVECPKGHRWPLGTRFCGICGARILPPEEIGAASATRAHTLFIGVGEAGGSVLLDYYRLFHSRDYEDSYLVLNTSGEEIDKLLATAEKAVPKDLTFKAAVRKIGGTRRSAGHNWKVGEELVKEDRLLREHLDSAYAEKAEAILLITSLGGGTGAGVGPLLLDSIPELSPKADRLALAALPAEDEPDQLHFNAYCGLSRLIKFRERRNADLILLVDNGLLALHKSIDREGRELHRNEVLASILGLITQRTGLTAYRWLDVSDLVQMSRSSGIVHYTPCLALSHSLRIYDDIPGVLDSAAARPLANIDPATSLFSFLFLRIPSALKLKLSIETIQDQYHRWKESNLPLDIAGDISIVYKPELTDRIDAMLLLGGCDLKQPLSRMKEGYIVVRSSVLAASKAASGQGAPPQLTAEELSHIEGTLVDYISQVESMRSGVARKDVSASWRSG